MKMQFAAGFLALALFGVGCQLSHTTGIHDVAVQTKETQAALTPDMALARLRAGNERFVTGQPVKRNLPEQVHDTASGQYPYAVILSCIDSRQPVEMVFDTGIGDVFNARVAGNVLNEDILGSMEYACKVAGVKLIVVLGHSSCGAIKGAVDHTELGNLTGLLDKIKPAIAEVSAKGKTGDSHDYEFVQEVAEANVLLVMKQIREKSPILREMIDQKKVEIVGGMYDLKTGKVRFYGD